MVGPVKAFLDVILPQLPCAVNYIYTDYFLNFFRYFKAKTGSCFVVGECNFFQANLKDRVFKKKIEKIFDVRGLQKSRVKGRAFVIALYQVNTDPLLPNSMRSRLNQYTCLMIPKQTMTHSTYYHDINRLLVIL